MARADVSSRKSKKGRPYQSKTRKRNKGAKARKKYWENKKNLDITEETLDRQVTQPADEYVFREEEEENLPQLRVHVEPIRRSIPIPASRRVINLQSFVEEIRSVENHTYACAFGGTLIHTDTINQGLSTTMKFQCSKILCSAEKRVTTVEAASINSDVVRATMSVGMGFYQSEEYFAVLQVPFMSNTTYQKYEKQVGDIFKEVQIDVMNEAIEEEKKIAAETGNIHENGMPCIAVTVDGGWSKRSYGHGFSANSGVAVIIGDKTKKIIFQNVRNKYCVICKVSAMKKVEIPVHSCNSNWKSSSSAMEKDIIVEGVKWLHSEHGIMCTKLTGDGDSSVMKSIRERVPYASSVGVRKVECTNHAIKNFKSKLINIGNNTKAFPRKDGGLKARRILQENTTKLTTASRKLIQKHYEELQTLNSNPMEISNSLKSSLRQLPKHIFGEHVNCASIFDCENVNEEFEVNNMEVLMKVGMYEAIDEAVIRLCAMTDSLILNKTNNGAENFMSAMAKVIGGKRVDFSKGQSYSRRASAAVLSHTKPGQSWHCTVHNKIYNCDPRTPMTKMVAKRKRRLQTNARNSEARRLFCDGNTKVKHSEKRNLDYGAIDDDHLGELCDTYYREKVAVTPAEIINVEEKTREQSDCRLWMEERRRRITASNFKLVAKRQDTTLSATLVNQLLYPKNKVTEAMQWGKVNEENARRRYEEVNNLQVLPCGLVIDPDNPFLAASPDGIVEVEGNRYIIEIKCPFVGRYSDTISQACMNYPNFPLCRNVDGTFFLEQKHPNYYQIQAQLQCTKLQRCDYIVYIPNDMVVLSILPNVTFMGTHLPKVHDFFFDCLLPELSDPRSYRKLPLREPNRILEARRIAAENPNNGKKPTKKKTVNKKVSKRVNKKINNDANKRKKVGKKNLKNK